MSDFDLIHDILECPVCYQKLRPPIKTCENGHGICKKCQPRVSACVLCKKKFTNAPNILFNQVLEKMPFECKFSPQGCSKSLRLDLLVDHEKFCYYREDHCYMCDKEFPFHKLNNHMTSCRQAHHTTLSKKIVIDCEIPDKELEDYYLVYITDIQTHFLMRFVENPGKVAFCVQYMGKDQKNAGKYKYDVRINQGLPDTNFTCSAMCVPYFYSSSEIKKQKKRIEFDSELIFLTDEMNSSKIYNLEVTFNEVRRPEEPKKCEMKKREEEKQYTVMAPVKSSCIII